MLFESLHELASVWIDETLRSIAHFNSDDVANEEVAIIVQNYLK